MADKGLQNFIPILDLVPEIEMMRKELDAAYRKVMDHGHFILGPEVDEFEQQVADYLGVDHAIGVNSGTDALVIALRAAGIGEGDEVITSPFTFFATAESISIVNAKPVFVDIDEQTYNLDPDLVEAAITDRTKAILPVHLYGRPVAMTPLMDVAEKNDLIVIEDCAQSFGAAYEGVDLESDLPSSSSGLAGEKTGSIGRAGAFSFFPTKNLGGFGDGGMITTNDEEIAHLSRKLRAHGSLKKYHNELLGYNSRLDTLQAALLQVKLKYIELFNENRRKTAQRYIDAFRDLKGILPPVQPDDGHVYHQFTVRILGDRRDEIVDKLKEKGIGTMIYYPVPCHELPVYRKQTMESKFPVCDALKREVISLPIGGAFDSIQQERVIQSVYEVLQ